MHLRRLLCHLTDASSAATGNLSCLPQGKLVPHLRLAILESLTPHLLQRVFGPLGPVRQTGVDVAPQLTQPKPCGLVSKREAGRFFV